MLKNYYKLTKPGIVYGNVFTTLAGLLFASRWGIAPMLLVATLSGIALVIASACVFNNYIDREIDGKMQRTKSRALVVGSITAHDAVSYGIFLGIIGFFVLYSYVNILTATVAVMGFIFYVFCYTFSKRMSHWGTVVGSVSGAIPIVVGYTAVTNTLDLPSFLLFVILALWQMPHFYAIAMYRMEDYVAAEIPVLPSKKGIRTTKIHIVLYIAAFIVATSLLTIFGYAGYSYLFVVTLVGLMWLFKAVTGFNAADDTRWARKLFFFSLIVLVVFSVALSLARVLP